MRQRIESGVYRMGETAYLGAALQARDRADPRDDEHHTVRRAAEAAVPHNQTIREVKQLRSQRVRDAPLEKRPIRPAYNAPRKEIVPHNMFVSVSNRHVALEYGVQELGEVGNQDLHEDVTVGVQRIQQDNEGP
jgi:hypothetical protein